MAVETRPGAGPVHRVTPQGVPGAPTGSTGRPGALLPGERVVSELDSGGEGQFRLTNARVIYYGVGAAENGAVYSTVQLKDIASVQITRRPRARRSAAWGVVGLFSAIGVWQVTPDSRVGIVAALAVALVSFVLMADYWIRPAGVHLEFQTAGGKIGGEVGGKTTQALAFARAVEDERRKPVPGRVGAPFRNYPSG